MKKMLSWLLSGALFASTLAMLPVANLTASNANVTAITASAKVEKTVICKDWGAIAKAIGECNEEDTLKIELPDGDIEAKSQIKIDKACTIEFITEGTAFYDRCKETSLFYLDKENITLKLGMSVFYGQSSTEKKEGGGIYVNQEKCIIEGGWFQSYTADNGGAIYVNDDRCTIIGTGFNYCTAKKDGGAVYLNGDRCLIKKCRFVKNSANNGGAIYVDNSDSKIESTSFDENTAKQNGGSIYMSEEGEILNNWFTNCTANNGGAIYDDNYYGGDLYVQGCVFIDCTAKTSGNFVFSKDDAHIKNCSEGNATDYYGVKSLDVPQDLPENHITSGSAIQTIINNLKEGERADIYLDGDITIESEIKIKKSCDLYFHAPKGGCKINIVDRAFYLDEEEIKLHFLGNITLNGTRVFDKKGQAFYVNDNNCLIEGAMFTFCSSINNKTEPLDSDLEGGAIYVNGKGCTIRYCTFDACEARGNGGAILVKDEDCRIEYCVFKYCAAKLGGAIYVYYGADNCVISQCGFESNKSLFDANRAPDVRSSARTMLIDCQSKEEDAIGCAIFSLEGFVGRSEIGSGHIGSIFSNGAVWIVVGVVVVVAAAVAVIIIVRKKKSK